MRHSSFRRSWASRYSRDEIASPRRTVAADSGLDQVLSVEQRTFGGVALGVGDGHPERHRVLGRRVRLDQFAAELRKRRHRGLEGLTHLRLEHREAEVRADGDPKPAQVVAGRLSPHRAGRGARAPRTGPPGAAPAITSSMAATSGTVRAHRAVDRQRRPAAEARPRRHEPMGRLVPDDPAERGRDADRPSSVGADGQRSHAGGDGDARAAARAARRPVEVPRVAGEAPERRVCVAPVAELRVVRLADDDRSGVRQPADGDAVRVGHEVGEDT